MDKIKAYLSSTEGLGTISMILAGGTMVVNYLLTKATNEKIINDSAQKAAEIVLSTTENKETA